MDERQPKDAPENITVRIAELESDAFGGMSMNEWYAIGRFEGYRQAAGEFAALLAIFAALYFWVYHWTR